MRLPNDTGSPGSHLRNWSPAETFDDYLRNCKEGLETWSERRVAKLLGLSSARLWRCMWMAELPEDLFEALLARGRTATKFPTSRQFANIARALRGDLTREVERCPHCGEVLRVRNVCSPELAEVVNQWLANRS
jgi:hypothetical protein